MFYARNNTQVASPGITPKGLNRDLLSSEWSAAETVWNFPCQLFLHRQGLMN